MSMCNCNQGRLPCTCKPIERVTTMRKINISTGHPDAGRVYAEALDRVTAERDALQQRLNEADQENDSLKSRLKSASYDRSGLRDKIDSLRDILPECENCRGFGEVSDGHSSFDCWKCSGTGVVPENTDGPKAKLAERDALLHRIYEASEWTRDAAHYQEEVQKLAYTALSASAEPKCQDGGMCRDSSHKCTGCKPVERDERAPYAPSEPSGAFMEMSDAWTQEVFSKRMIKKLEASAAKGRYGWQQCSQESLSRMLREHVEKGDPVDVANFCMFLDALGYGIAALDKATEGASHE